VIGLLEYQLLKVANWLDEFCDLQMYWKEFVCRGDPLMKSLDHFK